MKNQAISAYTAITEVLLFIYFFILKLKKFNHS